MTGTLKYAIELPPPSQGGEIKDFNFDDDGASHSSGFPGDTFSSEDEGYSYNKKNSFSNDCKLHIT